ncbi:MAG: redoxin domain-containing protein [Nannocystaceae bacterium]
MKRLSLATLVVVFAGCSATPEPKPAAAPTKTPAKAPEAEKPASPPTEPDKPIVAAAKIGAPAPDFTLNDLAGKPHKLSDYRGKTVVLEWFNPGCPFVKFAHGKGPLQGMAGTYTEKGIVWLAINSGGPGKQGHGVEANRAAKDTWKMGHPILIDETGDIGHTYEAAKTPHVFVVNDKGILVYRGALDNAPIGEVDGGGEKVNYLANALAEVAEGKAVTRADVPPYGCSVKYAK